MKATITVGREQLLYVLDRAILFIKKKTVLPVEGMFLFSPKGDVLGVRSFDGATHLDMSCQAMTKGEATPFLVDAIPVHKIISLSLEDTVVISFKGKDNVNAVVFTMGRNKHTFPVYDDIMPEPDVHEQSMGTMHTFSGADISLVSTALSPVVDPSNSTPVGEGVHMEYVESKQSAFFYAMSGTGIYAGAFRIPVNMPSFPKTTIPLAVMRNLHRLLLGDERVTFYFTTTKCVITGDNFTIITSVGAGKYPDLYRLMFRNEGTKDTAVTISAGELRLATDKVSVHTTDDMRSIKLSFEDKQMSISVANDPRKTDGVEVVPYISAEQTAGGDRLVDIKALQAVIKLCDSDMSTIYFVSNQKTPIFIENKKNNGTLTFLVAPLGQ